jgi:hypothetical protein
MWSARSHVIYFFNLVQPQTDKYENAPSERSSIYCGARASQDLSLFSSPIKTSEGFI